MYYGPSSSTLKSFPKCFLIILVFSYKVANFCIICAKNKVNHKISKHDTVCDWLSLCDFQIMDEADRLLEQGCTDFTKDLETIMSILPAKRQTLLFSATLTDTLQELKSIAMNQPFFWESKSE